MDTYLKSHATCLIGTSKEQLLDQVVVICEQQQIHRVDTLQFLDQGIGIADIKVVQRFLSNKPFTSPAKLVILAAWQLTLIAQQALLKVLEEPPPRSMIVLLTQNEQELLPTILSRCQITRLQPPVNLHVLTFDTELVYWTTLFKKGIGERFKETPTLTKDRDELLLWLTRDIVFFRNVLLSFYETGANPLKLSASEICCILKSLIHARLLTSQNANTKLVLDHVFLRLPTRMN
jgi:hypothetical protein